jgi:hypothetical protein
MAHKRAERTAVVTVGYAADEGGRGVVYAKMWSSTQARSLTSGSEPIVRVGFRTDVRPALRGREVAYAAVEAAARELLVAGVTTVEVRVADAQLASDLAERRSVPADLAIPYIALRCVLNRFASFSVVACDDGTARDLTARARADVSLHVAA